MRIQKILVLRNFYLRFYNEKEIYNVNVFVCYAENLITLYISFLCFMMLQVIFYNSCPVRSGGEEQ